jgi:hypothetical protein
LVHIFGAEDRGDCFTNSPPESLPDVQHEASPAAWPAARYTDKKISGKSTCRTAEQTGELRAT